MKVVVERNIFCSRVCSTSNVSVHVYLYTSLYLQDYSLLKRHIFFVNFILNFFSKKYLYILL